MTEQVQPAVNQGEKVGEYTVFRKAGEFPLRIRTGQPIPLLRDNDPAHLRPQVVADGKVRMFVMSNSQDAEAYAKVVDGAAKGEIVLAKEEVKWSELQQSFVVFARWHEMYQELPRVLQPNGGANVPGVQFQQ